MAYSVKNKVKFYPPLQASQAVPVVKNPPANTGDTRDASWLPGLGRSPRVGIPAPIFLLGKFHGQRNLPGPSPWGCKESYTTAYYPHLSK